MAHYDKIPQLLDHLITCSVAEACRRVGITPQTFWNYIVQSKLGHPKLQEIEFCGVVAPLHVCYQNSKALASQMVEQNALERARDGCWVDVFYQGVRQYEKVKRAEYADYDDDDIEMIFGKDHVDEAYELKPTRQWLKPSDALVIKMLESWHKKYRSHQQLDISFGGVLRLERPEERTATKTIEHAPQVFEDDADEAEQRGGHLAIARSAKSSEELDKWAAQGEFNPAPVKFVSASGEETTLIAPERPDIAALRKQAAELKVKGPTHRQPGYKPDATEQPDDQPIPTPAPDLRNHPRAYWAPGATPKPAPRDPGLPRAPQPLDSAGLGPGRVPPGGFKVG